ncbi:MAG: cyclic nucleotide-binding domain-containing protein [Anaeromyxobacteraceae bacterium]
MTAIEALQRSALFRDFTETGLKIFASIAQEKALPAGAPLFAENMVGESLFIVKSGTVRITQRGPEGQPKELGALGAGDHLGGMALLGKSVRQVTATAATPVELLEITHRDFLRLQPQKPQACLKLAVAIGADSAGRVSELREALRDLPGR